MSKTLTVKFVSIDDGKFEEYAGNVIKALGVRDAIDGVYVEMVSTTDINQQIDDIREVVMHCENPDDAIIAIDKILFS